GALSRVDDIVIIFTLHEGIAIGGCEFCSDHLRILKGRTRGRPRGAVPELHLPERLDFRRNTLTKSHGSCVAFRELDAVVRADMQARIWRLNDLIGAADEAGKRYR